MCKQMMRVENIGGEIVEGVLAGLGLSSNKTKTEACIQSAAKLQQVK
jgi:hypothetical protein